jgi:hypothetical protein
MLHLQRSATCCDMVPHVALLQRRVPSRGCAVHGPAPPRPFLCTAADSPARRCVQRTTRRHCRPLQQTRLPSAATSCDPRRLALPACRARRHGQRMLFGQPRCRWQGRHARPAGHAGHDRRERGQRQERRGWRAGETRRGGASGGTQAAAVAHVTLCARARGVCVRCCVWTGVWLRVRMGVRL